jgi:hypothetical protein
MFLEIQYKVCVYSSPQIPHIISFPCLCGHFSLFYNLCGYLKNETDINIFLNKKIPYCNVRELFRLLLSKVTITVEIYLKTSKSLEIVLGAYGKWRHIYSRKSNILVKKVKVCGISVMTCSFLQFSMIEAPLWIGKDKNIGCLFPSYKSRTKQ